MNETSTLTAVDIVASAYAAFGSGDIPALLALLADDITWEHHGVTTAAQSEEHPLLVARTGTDGSIEFVTEAGRMEIHEFAPHTFLAAPDSGVVAVLVDVDMTYPSGGRFRDAEVHVWTVRPDGLVGSVRHVVDTAKHLDAWRGVSTV